MDNITIGIAALTVVPMMVPGWVLITLLLIAVGFIAAIGAAIIRGRER